LKSKHNFCQHCGQELLVLKSDERECQLYGMPWVSKVDGPEVATAYRGQKVYGPRPRLPGPIASAAHGWLDLTSFLVHIAGT